MSKLPTPKDLAPRFRRRPIKLSQRQNPWAPGWNDGLSLPMEEHFYLDTGIYHSIACSVKVINYALVKIVKGHEANSTISNEVRTQRSDTTLSLMKDELLPRLNSVAKTPCDFIIDIDKIEDIRNELIADAQQRHPNSKQSRSARAKHGGEAELIHLAEQHDPPARLICNDAGASAVGARHGLSSMHFLHLLRAAVRAEFISVDEALIAAEKGLSESGLERRERSRTEHAQWLKG